jgi:hypothetical protein
MQIHLNPFSRLVIAMVLLETRVGTKEVLADGSTTLDLGPAIPATTSNNGGILRSILIHIELGT